MPENHRRTVFLRHGVQSVDQALVTLHKEEIVWHLTNPVSTGDCPPPPIKRRHRCLERHAECF